MSLFLFTKLETYFLTPSRPRRTIIRSLWWQLKKIIENLQKMPHEHRDYESVDDDSLSYILIQIIYIILNSN